MSREVWIGEAIQTDVPDMFVVLAALLTRLGDPVFLAVLLVAAYWIGESDEQIAVIGIALSGLTVIVGLKHAFALPRPTWSPVVKAVPWGLQWVYESATAADGYGFPSGHAMGATVVYTLLATSVDVGRRRLRYAGVAAVIAVVALSRVVLGVHFLVDVVAGIVIGIVFVLLGRRLLAAFDADSGTVALALAVTLGTLAAVISGGGRDGALLLGSALGAFGGWQCVLLDRLDRLGPARTAGPIPLAHSYPGSLATVGILPLFGALAAGVLYPPAAVGAAVGLALAVAVAVAAPTISASASTSPDSAREFGTLWRRRLTVEGRVLLEHSRSHDLALFERAVLRLAALLYLLPALIAIESFSGPVQLPSPVIDVVAALFGPLVANPIMFVQAIFFEPFGVDGVFEVPLVGELLRLAVLFVVYLCCAGLIHNGRVLIDTLSERDARPDHGRDAPLDPGTSDPEAPGPDGADSATVSDGGSKTE